MIVLVILFILLVLWMGKECHSLHRFNYEGQIQELQSLNEVVIKEKMKDKNPLLIHNVTLPEINLSQIITDNPGYIIKDKDRFILLDKFRDKDMSVYQSESLYNDLGYRDKLSFVSDHLETKMSCNKRGYLSLFKGFHTIELTPCIHNVNIVSVVSGSGIMYMINPKHKNDIQGKTNQEVKKWCQRVILKPGSILSIPPNWYYFYECKADVIIYNYESDVYGTYLYNLLR